MVRQQRGVRDKTTTSNGDDSREGGTRQNNSREGRGTRQQRREGYATTYSGENMTENVKRTESNRVAKRPLWETGQP